MIRRAALIIITLLFASLLMGCGPRWVIIAQANPNPLMGQKTIAVKPIDFSNLQVGNKSEAEYKEKKSEKKQDSFDEDKRGINDEFTARLIEVAGKHGIQVVLATGPNAAPFLIQPVVPFVEGGVYAYMFARNSQVQMTVRITTPDGGVIDEIQLQSSTAASLGNPSSGGRLRSDGANLGKILGAYLGLRMAGPQ